MRPHREKGAPDADDQPASDKPAVLGEDKDAQLARAEADGFQQAKFAPALEDVARHDNRQADAASKSPRPPSAWKIER